MSEKQRTRKAKITFETRETTFEVVFLMSYVSISACGTVFEVWGMASSDKRQKRAYFGWRRYNCVAGERELYFWDALAGRAAAPSGHQPPHKNVRGETCDKTLPEAILAGRAQRPNPPKTRRASGSDGKGGGHSVQHCAILDHSLRQCD